jgi:uncharacterized protein (DUF952 family)
LEIDARMILHLMPLDEWRSWRDGEPYQPDSLASEGFVHCTGDDVVLLDVANRFYGDADAVVAVSLDPEQLTHEVRWEPPAHPDGTTPEEDAPLFPHVYGPLDREAVTGVRRLARVDGRFAGYVPMA